VAVIQHHLDGLFYILFNYTMHTFCSACTDFKLYLAKYSTDVSYASLRRVNRLRYNPDTSRTHILSVQKKQAFSSETLLYAAATETAAKWHMKSSIALVCNKYSLDNNQRIQFIVMDCKLHQSMSH
jgi:hypothetical protein